MEVDYLTSEHLIGFESYKVSNHYVIRHCFFIVMYVVKRKLEACYFLVHVMFLNRFIVENGDGDINNFKYKFCLYSK